MLPTFLYAQESLDIALCQSVNFEVNDHSDSDSDGVVCEGINLVLSNNASYEDDIVCDLSIIQWIVSIDLESDGSIDYEYRSDLPANDFTFNDSNNNGIPDMYIPPTMNNEVQNINLPDIAGSMAEHTVIWNVSDDCDLSDECSSNFLLLDKKAPTPFCVSLYTIEYEGDDTKIFAEDFNIGVFDNCTDQDDIRISFSKESIIPERPITCDDVINSPVLIQIYFWDESDNIDFCQAYVTVISNNEKEVDCYPDREVKGFVRTWDGTPIEGVEVTLDANLIEYPRTTLTDENGFYTFGIETGESAYALSAKFDDNYLSSVSSLDLVLTMRHILGIQPFDNPYHVLAADVNGDDAIKVNDLVLFRKLILGVISEFPDVPAWKFIDASLEFENANNPWPALDEIGSNYNPYQIKFQLIDEDGYDFIGIKLANVSNN